MPVATAVNLDSPRVKQLSDNNANGTAMGVSATDSVAFYTSAVAGAANGPVAQPSGNAQAAITRGAVAGTISTYASKQTPSSVATVTTAEQTFTVIAGTGAQYQLSTADPDIVVAFNKPTADAGVGIGNVRVSSANTLGVSFLNVTAGTLTPTATQTYGIVALRGFNVLTATITPAAVVSQTTVEQQFAVTGLRSGELVAVNRNAGINAGLEIVGARVVSNNTLGITFMNTTAGTLTPTAATAYNVISLGGLDAVNNSLYAQVSSLTPASVATATTAAQNITTALITTNDIVVNVVKPTVQAGIGVYGGKVSGTAGLSVAFFNVTAGTLTPTAGEIYGVGLYRAKPLAPLVVYSQTLAPASVAATTTAEQTFTVTGIVANSALWVNKPSATPGIGIVGCRVSSANNIGITYANITAAAITPPTETYIIGNYQMLVDTTDGNSIVATASLVQQQTSQMANALRAALVGTTGVNLIAGA